MDRALHDRSRSADQTAPALLTSAPFPRCNEAPSTSQKELCSCFVLTLSLRFGNACSGILVPGCSGCRKRLGSNEGAAETTLHFNG